jgi:hypothetical protein
MKFDQWQMPLLVIAGVVCISAFCRYPADSSSAVAAWVQGIGSLLAVGTAVWLYAKQYRDKRADDLAETVAFVQAMRHEIQVIWDEYSDIRDTLLKTPANGFYSSVVPLSTDSLIVYSRTPERVGKIDDEDLRALVVRTYTGLRGHLNSLRQNNDLLDDYERFFTLHKGDDRQTLKERKDSILQEYTAGLKNGDRELEKLVKQFLADTGTWVSHQQDRTS